MQCIAFLTHLPLHKMAAISQAIFSDTFFANEKLRILIKISPKFVSKGQIDKKAALD